MGFKAKKNATSHTVANGETLQSIATARSVSLADLTRYNFGTTNADAVNRALFEVVGARKMGADGYWAFSADDSTRGTGKLLIPQPWTRGGLATNKLHTISLQRTKPMPAVSISNLDKWFIPGAAVDGGELCKIEYGLEGIRERADKVTFEVRGSNYCSTTVDNAGKVTYTAVAGSDPIYSEDLAAGKTAPGSTHAITDYRGVSSAGAGMLQKKNNVDRYLNVIFSPYTVLLRYHKSDADKQARILLEDFWPVWQANGTIDATSLKVKWKVENGAKLKHGTILFVDRSDTVVFIDGLNAAKISGGEYTWSGKQRDGTDITQANMPYRVQLQVHSEINEDQGLALAVMQTEVRLFVHKETGTRAAAETFKEKNSLHFSFAPLVPEAEQRSGRWVTKEPTSGIKWYQYNLGIMGFHSGPVDGDHGNLSQRALREFQRAYPKSAGVPYDRLWPNGNRNGDTRTALQRARQRQDEVGRQWRSWFGDPGKVGWPSRDPDFTMVKAEERLNKNDVNADAQGLLVWVDDRHYYTEAGSTRMYMRNYRRGFNIGDQRVNRDAESICRPWIPLQVDLPLLSRSSGARGLASETGDSTRSAAARKAVAPVRVDWSFEEIGENLAAIPAGYNAGLIRTRKWVQMTVDARKGTRNGKDYTNCPQNLGGIRPANLAGYYKIPFGMGSLRLQPWAVVDDTANERLSTLVHDDLGQAADRLYPLHQGRAGIFLHLSRIAGDGYRFRAAVNLEELAGSAFPNATVLKKRYPRVPAAHTTRVRQWRRSSYKAYVAWCPPANANWPGNSRGAAMRYAAAQIHMDNAGITPSTANLLPLTGATPLITQARFRQVVRAHDKAPFTAHAAGISLHAHYVWPYLGVQRFGIRVGNTGSTINNFVDQILSTDFDNGFEDLSKPLLLELLSRVERNYGLLKGHLVAEFRSSPRLNLNQYRCNRCNRFRTEPTNLVPAGNLLAGQACVAVGCTGTYALWANGGVNDITQWGVGYPLGATWVIQGQGLDFWAHEIGHLKHLEHAIANPGSTAPNVAHALGGSWWNAAAGRWDRCGASPGAKANQHDAQRNTRLWAISGTTGPFQDQQHPDKDHRWDRKCVMSYDSAPQFFCGKCILKLRGWRVEGLTNPGGLVTD